MITHHDWPDTEGSTVRTIPPHPSPTMATTDQPTHPDPRPPTRAGDGTDRSGLAILADPITARVPHAARSDDSALLGACAGANRFGDEMLALLPPWGDEGPCVSVEVTGS